VEAIRDALDGAIPGVIATCARDGTPNVSFVSQVHFVDAAHVALSFQFFSKTRENVLANPRATALVIHPRTGVQHRLALHYLHTQTQGPLFESMKAKLAGIASHTGMSGVFRLLGADLYRVLDLEEVPDKQLPAPPPRCSLLPAMRAFAQRLAACTDLATLLDQTLSSMESLFGIAHAMLLLLDEPGVRLYTVASRGYAPSGVGSEIPLGHGVIGVCARERTPIRITHMTSEYTYSRAMRDSAQASGLDEVLETEIPLPGLAQPRSQLAVPIVLGKRLLGVLFAESSEDQRFGYDDEDALVAIAAQVGMGIHALQQASESQEEAAPEVAQGPPVGEAVTVIRHYAADDSVFLGDDYLIKGVAGAIFWKLVHHYSYERRTEFTNRELRLDASIRLPDITDNLEARLILLQRRLAERAAPVFIEKTGRGRFRLCVRRPVRLVEMAA
jgi:adenylate cyclase